jgi:hypothetical protein
MSETTRPSFPVGTQLRAVRLEDETFSIEVTLPGQQAYAMMVFSTEQDALRWIAEQEAKMTEH